MTRPSLRCAIYTRVSSDSGLEQEFNSLDAQREAAEAYVKSQAHEGWRLIKDRFDDGGYSGGTMERPALQRLLALVREGRVDVIVVYKVDRLTRSLSDFARLVELFDAHKTSFVSVTQAFNTTSSMGRLTLNVLLSFAQFEREVTGERIRDKIAASKQKGIWMGGVVPFGYRVEDRKLRVEAGEAEIVRMIFERYLALGSLPALHRELADRGVVSRRREQATGRIRGGVPFAVGALSHLLGNRTYLGELNHHGRSWPGEHEAIVEAATFAAVQARLAEQTRRRSAHSLPGGALLKGRLFTPEGEGYSPSYALKQGVRYRYYVARSLVQGRRGRALVPALARLPAEALEQAIVAALRSLHHEPIEDAASKPPLALPDHALVASWVDRVIVQQGTLDVRLRGDPDAGLPTRLDIPWTKPVATRRRQIILPADAAANVQPIRVEEQARLVKAIATARRWVEELIAGDVADITALAGREDKTVRSIRMALSLAFLDPRLVEAACAGRLPRGYSVSRLVDLPPDFDDQWSALGMRRPG